MPLAAGAAGSSRAEPTGRPARVRPGPAAFGGRPVVPAATGSAAPLRVACAEGDFAASVAFFAPSRSPCAARFPPGFPLVSPRSGSPAATRPPPGLSPVTPRSRSSSATLSSLRVPPRAPPVLPTRSPDAGSPSAPCPSGSRRRASAPCDDPGDGAASVGRCSHGLPAVRAHSAPPNPLPLCHSVCLSACPSFPL